MHEIDIRSAKPEDLNFIFSSWGQTYLQASLITLMIRKETYWPEQQALMERLLEQSDVKVAHPRGEPDLILGYLVARSGLIHFCYVKQAFRRLGIMTKLLEAQGFAKDAQGVEFTHYTRFVQPLWKDGKLKAIYNPYHLMKGNLHAQ